MKFKLTFSDGTTKEVEPNEAIKMMEEGQSFKVERCEADEPKVTFKRHITSRPPSKDAPKDNVEIGSDYSEEPNRDRLAKIKEDRKKMYSKSVKESITSLNSSDSSNSDSDDDDEKPSNTIEPLQKESFGPAKANTDNVTSLIRRNNE